MRRLIAFLGLLVLVGVLPAFVTPPDRQATTGVAFPGWPMRFREASMRELPLGTTEQRFANDFPGRIAKFSDGRQRFIVRFIERPTRRLHPAADCFRASGYRVRALASCPAGASETSGCLLAIKGDQRLHVHERITDASGGVFRDVSAWYWATLHGGTRGPWWSVTTIAAAPEQVGR